MQLCLISESLEVPLCGGDAFGAMNGRSGFFSFFNAHNSSRDDVFRSYDITCWRGTIYLERVGEELLFKDRNRPVAKLVPLTSGDDPEAEEMEMVAAALMRLPDGDRPDSYRKMPAPEVSLVDAVGAVRAERDED